nr:hypothetical protein [Tanacetum cinerariifolium]
MVMQANRKRTDVEYKIEDMVIVKLQPYRQVTLAKHYSNKSAKRYYGPFEVLERIGKVAYRLALPESKEEYEGHPVEQPLAICESCVVLHRGLLTRQLLVQWMDKMISEGEKNVTLGLSRDERTKRTKSKPAWHKDYVMPLVRLRWLTKIFSRESRNEWKNTRLVGYTSSQTYYWNIKQRERKAQQHFIPQAVASKDRVPSMQKSDAVMQDNVTTSSRPVRRIHQLKTAYQPFTANTTYSIQTVNTTTNPTDVLTLVSGSVDRELLIKEAFSGTNGEDAVEHIENFLKIVDPLDLPNLLLRMGRLSVTCSSNDDGFYNGGELSRIVRVGYMTYFQDYLWYDDLADGKLKEEALKQKAIYERNHIRGTYANTNINANYNLYLDVPRTFHNYAGRNDDETIQKEWKLNDDHGNGNFDNDLVRDSEPYHANKEEEQYKEDRCEMLENPCQEPLVYKIGRFGVIKYSFRPTKKYIVIKKYEHNDLTRTNEDTCHAYQEIFRCMDEDLSIRHIHEYDMAYMVI